MMLPPGIPDSTPTTAARQWRTRAYIYAAALASVISYALYRVPFEVSDNLGNLLQLEEAESAWAMLIGTADVPGFMRPASWATTKFFFDISGGHYFYTYRTLHLVLIFALLLLFIHLLRVRSRTDALLVPVSTMALIGIHTFHETVRETELNIKLIIPILCLAAVALAASRHQIWKDIAATLILAYAVFANELGLLVWVCLVGGWLLGFRGVSHRALLACTAVIGVYFFLRFGVLAVGTPGLMERSSGFGLTSRDPAELERMFGDNPFVFYGYNVAASIMTVLFSEPRGGGFVFVGELILRRETVWMWLNVLTSIAGTTMIARHLWTRRSNLVSRAGVTHGDRIVVLSMMVVAASGVISYPYAKDITMSTAGVFWALALFFAVRSFLESSTHRELPLGRGILAVTLSLGLSIGWTLRGIGFFSDLRTAAYKAQGGWVLVYEWLDAQGLDLDTAGKREIVEQLRRQQLSRHTTQPDEGLFPEAMDPFH